jgi:hypothetical protein
VLRDVRVAVRRELLGQVASHFLVQARQLSLEVTAQPCAQVIINLAPKGDDLDDPAAARLLRGRMLQQKQMLDDPPRPAANSAAPFDAQIGDFLGEVREVERHVRAGCAQTGIIYLTKRPAETMIGA